ncbi:hypothetical protein D3C75_1082240 [compost metagenome]
MPEGQCSFFFQQRLIAVTHQINQPRTVHEQRCCTQRINRTEQAVAQIHNQIGMVPVNIPQYGFQCQPVTVNIRDYSYYIVHSPSSNLPVPYAGLSLLNLMKCTAIPAVCILHLSAE